MTYGETPTPLQTREPLMGLSKCFSRYHENALLQALFW